MVKRSSHKSNLSVSRSSKCPLGVVQFSVRVSQSFPRKDLGGWVGEKPFTCDVCSSSFFDKHHMQQQKREQYSLARKPLMA